MYMLLLLSFGRFWPIWWWNGCLWFALDQLQAFHVAPARAVGNVNFGSFSVDVKVGRPADSLNCLRGSTFFAESVDWADHKSRGWLCESRWFAKGFMALTSVCGCFPQIMIWGRSRICNHECLTFKVAFGSLCWTINYRWIIVGSSSKSFCEPGRNGPSDTKNDMTCTVANRRACCW